MTPSVVWLASYPKAGSTWVRALLTSASQGTAPDLARLEGWALTSLREYLDDTVGLESSDLTPAELFHYRRLFHLRLSADGAAPLVIKVHDAFETQNGLPLFPLEVTRGVIYLVRDPRDVALSYAHHRALPVDLVIDDMASPGHALRPPGGGPGELLEQRLGTWSSHTQGWLASGFPLHLVRFEDLLDRTADVLHSLSSFAGLPLAPAVVEAAVSACRFERLQDQERAQGFPERQPTASSFFRSGTSGGWREQLTDRQRRRIETDHGEMMRRLGYLAPVEDRPRPC